MPSSANRRLRLAIVISHPIQHFVPFYRALARDPRLELRVFFGSRIGLQRYFDEEMGTEIAWSMDLLSGYDHEFLAEADHISRAGFWSVNNPSVSRALDAFHPDVVKLCGYSQLTTLRALCWCKRRGVPALMWSDSELVQARGRWKRAVKGVVLRPLLRAYDAFLTVGDNNETYLRHYGAPPSRMYRTPFTIDEAGFAPIRDARDAIRSETRARLGVPPEAFTALFVGKLSSRKRPGDVVAAVRAAASRCTGERPLYALFAGDGSLRAALEEEVATSRAPCLFLGFVNVDELPAVYTASDVLVHPSERDPHPLVISEAAFFGLPVVVSDRVGCAGPTDSARPGENALVYRCGDVAEDPARVAELYEHLLAWPAAHAARIATVSRGVVSPIEQEQLRALGYAEDPSGSATP